MHKQATNPFLPDYEYIPDGEPRVFGDRIYLYGSHDRFAGSSFCPNDYVGWSASLEDLSDWRYEGVIYKKEQDPLNTDGQRRLFAPDVQKGSDGRYYLYYTLDTIGVMSVAVCSEPAGKYEFYGHVRYSDGRIIGQNEGDIFQYDPGVFAENGRIFLYSGFAAFPERRKPFEDRKLKIDGGYFMELEPDMLTVKGEPKLIFPRLGDAAGTSFEGHEFFEGSSIRKIGEQYYFIYTSANRHELCYAVSRQPDKDFIFGGTLISNGDVNIGGRSEREALNYFGNNHGSIVQVKGQWYVFYHRHTNCNQYSRQACAEPIQIKENGAIMQVEMTSSGLNNGPLQGEGEYRAAIACNLMSGNGIFNYLSGKPEVNTHPYFTQEGQDREENGNQYIANMQNGAMAGYKYFVFDSEKKDRRIILTLRGTGKGKVLVYKEIGGEPVAEILVDTQKEWKEFEAPLTMMNGTCALYFVFCGSGSLDFSKFTLN